MLRFNMEDRHITTCCLRPLIHYFAVDLEDHREYKSISMIIKGEQMSDMLQAALKDFSLEEVDYSGERWNDDYLVSFDSDYEMYVERAQGRYHICEELYVYEDCKQRSLEGIDCDNVFTFAFD